MSREAFITGSQLFGYATPESDTDLVLFMPYGELCLMVERLGIDTGGEDYGGGNGFRTLRINNLNIICCWDTVIYDAFKTAKDEIMRRPPGPMNREISVEIHERHRKEALAAKSAAEGSWYLG